MPTSQDLPHTPVKFAQVNLTVDLAYKEGGSGDLQKILQWISGCLNCNTNHVVATLSNATDRLGWPDFLDAPSFSSEHPDYPAAVEALNKVESWLAMDRKALIGELLKQHSQASFTAAVGREMRDAIETLVPHVLHYASMPHASSEAHRDAANARAVIAKL